jgi:hypothetical protein
MPTLNCLSGPFIISIFSSRVSSYHHVLSISSAHFITAGTIDLKLCTYVALDHMGVQTEFQSDLSLGLAMVARTENTKSA